MHKVRKTAILLTGLCVVLVCVGATLFYKEKTVLREPVKISDAVVVNGALAQTKIKALLETKNGSYFLSGLTDPSTAKFNTKDGTVLSPPYKISLTLDKNGHYRDIALSVDKSRSAFIVQAGGFSPDDKITLTLNDQAVYKELAFDWSGHLLVRADVPAGKDVQACISVTSSENDLGICHVLGEGRTL